MANVEGKTVIVTGAAGGMGRSHARMLAAGGANVVIADLLSNEGSALAQEIGERTRFIRHDVTDAASWGKSGRRHGGGVRASDVTGEQCGHRLCNPL